MPWKMINKGKKEGEIRIYGVITDFQMFKEDTTPTGFQEELDAMGDIELLTVYLNTPGGGTAAGNTIYNILKRHPAVVHTKVDGIAASMGATILQAGDERSIALNGQVFMHNPLGCICGYASDLRKYANWLDKTQEGIMSNFSRLKIDNKKLTKIMEAETLLTANESLQMGFVDKIDDDSVDVNVENKNVTFNGVTFNADMYRHFDISKLEQYNVQNKSGNNDIEEYESRFSKMFENQIAINNLILTKIN